MSSKISPKETLGASVQPFKTYKIVTLTKSENEDDQSHLPPKPLTSKVLLPFFLINTIEILYIVGRASASPPYCSGQVLACFYLTRLDSSVEVKLTLNFATTKQGIQSVLHVCVPTHHVQGASYFASVSWFFGLRGPYWSIEATFTGCFS